MADELNDIFASNQNDISDDQLLKYLKGELTKDELREVELAMINSGMLSDAADGLQDMANDPKLAVIREKINANLQKQLKKRKKKKERRRIVTLPWTVVFIVVILLLLLISFAVVYLNR